MTAEPPVRFLGRYAMHGELASGGMATVHLGRLLGPVGFARTVAIKRLHPQYAKDPHFVAMFLDEARLAARIRHPNVVPTLDVVALEGEVFLVMEHVHGESLSRLLATVSGRAEHIPMPIAVGIMLGVLHGLHAAHEAKSDRGDPLDIVHRDVSPQNVIVGVDGVAKVLDFGVAKAVGRLQTTEDGDIKGKMPYMAPEQLRSEPVDRRADVWAASVVLWEMLASRRLFTGESPASLVHAILEGKIEPPSHVSKGSPELDAIVMRGLEKAPEARFQTAREMALALEQAVPSASARAIGDWVEATAGDTLRVRAARVEEMESAGGGGRSSDGSLRKQLAVLGFDAEKSVDPAARREPPKPLPSAEMPTGDAPGRIQRTASPRRGVRVVWILALGVVVAGAAALVVLQRSGAVPDAGDAIAAPPPPMSAPSAQSAVVSTLPVVVSPPAGPDASEPPATVVPSASHRKGGLGQLRPMRALGLPTVILPIPSDRPPTSSDAPSSSACRPDDAGTTCASQTLRVPSTRGKAQRRAHGPIVAQPESMVRGQGKPQGTKRAEPSRPALVVGQDARWLRLPSGERVELPRQRALRLILVAMVRERLAHPGRALTGETLLAQGWPGERVTPASGGLRVRVTVSRLRSIGLRELISSRDDGYLLRADASVVLESGPAAHK